MKRVLIINIYIYYKMLNEIIECPICLNDINNNEGILIPECCNNPVHLKCIMNWHKKNKNSKVCFICQQENSFSKDIYCKNGLEEGRENLLENDEYISENNYNDQCIKCTIYSAISSIAIGCITILIIFL